jgi:TonB family protein
LLPFPVRTLGYLLSFVVHCGAIGAVVATGAEAWSPALREAPRIELQSTPSQPPVSETPVVVPEVAAEALVAWEPSFVVEPSSDGESSDGESSDGELPSQSPLAEPSHVGPPEPDRRQGDTQLAGGWLAVVRPQPLVQPSPDVVATVVPPQPAPPPAVPSAFVEASRRADNLPPEYPLAERALGHQGTVVVRVELDACGEVLSAALVSPSPFPGLNRAALRAVRGWRFTPAQRHGVAVASQLDVPVMFQLRGG